MRRQGVRQAIANFCQRLSKIRIRLPRQRATRSLELIDPIHHAKSGEGSGTGDESKHNPAHPYIRRAASFQLTHHTPHSTPVRHEDFLGIRGARALTDFIKCVVERDSRVHFDWANKWPYALDANQTQIINEFREYLSTQSPHTAFINYKAPARGDSAATITFEQLISLRQQAIATLANVDEADKQYYINRFSAIIQQARQCLFYMISQREPEYFAALTEICNKDIGPVGKALGENLEQLMLTEYAGIPICVDRDRDEVLITRDETGITFEVMSVLIYAREANDEAKREAAYIHIRGHYDSSHRLRPFEAKHSSYTPGIWDEFQGRVAATKTTWATQDAIVARLNDHERRAVIRHCNSRYSTFSQSSSASDDDTDSLAASETKQNAPAFAGVIAS